MFSEGSAERWHSSLVLLEKPHWGPASLLSLSFLLFPVRVVAVRDLAGSQAKAKRCWIGTSQMPHSQDGCCDLPLWVRSKVSFLWECKLCIWRHWRGFLPNHKDHAGGLSVEYCMLKSRLLYWFQGYWGPLPLLPLHFSVNCIIRVLRHVCLFYACPCYKCKGT